MKDTCIFGCCCEVRELFIEFTSCCIFGLYWLVFELVSHILKDNKHRALLRNNSSLTSIIVNSKRSMME